MSLLPSLINLSQVASLDFEKVINFISKLNWQVGTQIVAIRAIKGELYLPGLFKLHIFQRKACGTFMIPDAQKSETICFPKQSLLLESNKVKQKTINLSCINLGDILVIQYADDPD